MGGTTLLVAAPAEPARPYVLGILFRPRENHRAPRGRVLCDEACPVYDHEFGHVRQSRRWGWLWLPVFAIPSGLHSLFCRAANYYHFYTERSANRLGGVPNYAGEYHYHMDGLIVTYWDKLVELKDKYFK